MKSTARFTISSAIVLAASLLGCAEDVGSENVRTGGLYAKYEALCSGNGTTEVEGQLRVGGKNGTWVQLNNGETLVASTPDDSVTLEHEERGDKHFYLGNLNGEESVNINVALNRTEEDVDAPDSNVLLPEPFAADFDEFDQDDLIPRGNDIVVIWSNEASGDMNWEISGSCIWTESGSTNDDGALTIKAEDVRVQDLDIGEDCEVTVTLERINEGDVDSEFGEGGEIVGIQRRAISYISTPAEDEVGGAGGAD